MDDTTCPVEASLLDLKMAEFVHIFWYQIRRPVAMASHFQNYVTNLNRVRLSEMIDHYAIQSRAVRLQPSLIFNPVTSRCYSEGIISAVHQIPSTRVAQ